YFLKRADLERWEIEADSLEQVHRIVAVPALAESENLFKTLSDLKEQSGDLLGETLILCVVNNRTADHASPESIQDNRKTLELLRGWKGSKLRIGIVDASSHGKELGANEGVGTARKIGLDLGSKVLLDHGLSQAPLISLDADCRVPANYLSEISQFFAEEERWAATVECFHPLDGSESMANLRGILAYETHLRYHELGLRRAGSPYAFPTIGSTIVCTAEAYVVSGGMRKRRAAEDFYFLQELAKTGRVEFITQTWVTPSTRSSDRVPFGTGRSMGAFLGEEKKFYRTYHPESYEILRKWLITVTEDPDLGSQGLMQRAKEFSSALEEFLQDRNFPKAWDRIQTHSKSREKRLQDFHRWFDAFRTLKAIHFLRDHEFGLFPLFPSVEMLLSRMGVETPFPFGDILPDDVDRQIEGLTFLRETMRRMKER
ncbi:MAG: hypothetical protein KC978_16345, partial [Candidatus Omnitrophica bacterium]|nr:hypothetical protein [Candidatus Omnitrophota bacterium]